MTPFVEAARQLVRGLEYQGGGLPTFYHVGRTLSWRHHGLGMLQAELSDTLRIHIWHPKLVDQGMAWPRCVHDHRFDIDSAVVVGEIIDWPHAVIDCKPNSWQESAPVRVFEIAHAKEQDRMIHKGYSTATSAIEILPGQQNAGGPLGVWWALKRPQIVWPAGREYRVLRRDFHTTLVEELAVTLVHRSNFDTQLARVLCAPDGDVTAVSGIVRDDSLDHKILVNWVLREAADAIGGMK